MPCCSLFSVTNLHRNLTVIVCSFILKKQKEHGSDLEKDVYEKCYMYVYLCVCVVKTHADIFGQSHLYSAVFIPVDSVIEMEIDFCAPICFSTQFH